MQFKTQYDARDRVVSNPGSREHIMYSGKYDEQGQLVLEESGVVNIYDEIQSHVDFCDIHMILKRYESGDVSALSQRQGFYMDVLDFPKTYAEALNRMNAMEADFMKLPVEVRERFGNSFPQFLAASGDSDFLEKLGVVVKQQEPAASVKEGETKE